MSKIVKYCSSCEEGFAEKFGFCPNCGSQLQAFAMNPVENAAVETTPQASIADDYSVAPPETSIENFSGESVAQPTAHAFSDAWMTEENLAANVAEPEFIPTPAPIVETVEPEIVNTAPLEEVDEIEPVEETNPFVEQKTFAASAGGDSYQTANYNDQTPSPKAEYVKDQGFYVTVIEDKNVAQRNMLLLGSLGLMIVFLLGATVYSLFAKDALIGAIDQGDLIASVPEIAPIPVDELPPPKKAKDDGGGGGGGGKQQDQDPSKGRLPPQVKDPQNLPDPNKVQVTNPAIRMPPQATKGDNPRPITDENTGLPNGLARNGSSGRGSGGGIGNGTGAGVGSGRGTGEGTGTGSGSGGGFGTGTGGGTGGGGDRNPPPPPPPPSKPPPPAGPTKGVTITSKPHANYTDAARTAQIQGTVTLKVTFLANGSIGSVSAVSGLPNGLTEQAIAAAHGIRFEPALKNGVPQTVTKSVQYSFTIY